MNFLARSPHPYLRAYIHRYVEMESGDETASKIPVEILPNGHSYLTFSYGKRPLLDEAGTTSEVPDVFLSGQATRADKSFVFSGRMGHFGVEFSPTAIYNLLGADVQMYELQDKMGALEELCPGRQLLSDRLYEAACFEERCYCMDNYFLERLKKTSSNPQLEYAVQMVLSRQGRLSVADICREVNLGPRQLRRHFQAQVGVSPKCFIGITQLKHIHHLASRLNDCCHHDLLHQGGFYDQSHFIRRFTKFMGESPSDFYKDYDQFLKFYLAGLEETEN